MLQETIVRNMPFCDEFIIVTKESYRNIVNGQMKVFQSLRYRLILENTPKGTAAAIMLADFFCNQSELVFVVTADHIIDLGPEGGNKGGTIVAQGTPEQICDVPESYTGQFLKPLLDKEKERLRKLRNNNCKLL